MSSSHNTESSNGENVKENEINSLENNENRVEADNCAANTAEVQSTSNVEPFQHTEVAEESTSSCSSPTGEENNPTSQSTDCCVPIPESAACVHGNARRMIGLIQAKGCVHGILKPEEFNLRPSRHSIGRNGLGDVTLNLTEFLSYAQRNNYDIVIPASREVGNLNRPASAGLPRIGSGRGYMVLEQQHFPQDFNATTSYHPPEFIGLNNAPSRNSVLAPNMYHAVEEIQPPAVDFSAPPPYEMPLKLPTYEEVQREKALEGEMLPPNMDTQNPDPASPRTLSFLAIDTDMGPNPDPESKLLGTDFMFGVAFFLALVFNWVGFLLLMCFCHTVAARYGALSGFGLSLAKWTIIVKNSTESPPHNAWLWWLITAFGLLICIRSLFQYINIKRGWRLMSTATQERLLFFY
ncbi:NEDD4 family-interacting protein 2 isoform X2 [Planococcus citri]|uniref:NEDD4 family-interacting protein 2 isoform X2 n=1 Tax=Planococcus citri TaxID=170843 RepID=UPI0031FA2789